MAENTELSRLIALDDPLLNFKWVTSESFCGLPKEFVEKIDIPFNNITIREGVYNGSSFTYFPGHHNISAFNVTFYEDNNASTLQWINQWKAAIKDFSTGRYNLPSEYKRDLTIYLLDQAGEKVIEAKLQGIFPAETSNLGLAYDSSSRLSIEQNFSCDNGDLKFLKASKYKFQ